MTAVAGWRRPGVAWCAAALLLALGSGLFYGLGAGAIDWQPARWPGEPWRAFSAAFVHYSGLHMAANVVGLLLVAALGVAARAPSRLALAWLAAWPLTQIGLLWEPRLLHYGGLSGVLHAGVAVVAVHLVFAGYRVLGGALLTGLLVKVLSEAPWGAPLRQLPGWDIAVVPLAHATGVLAGSACGLAAEVLARPRRRDSGP